MAYGSAPSYTLLFGGFNGSPQNDTWTYNGSWQQLSPTASPPARYEHALAYDAQRNVFVLFGGRNNAGYFGDTWEFDGNNWVQKSPATSPTARTHHSMTYDSKRGVVVLFGGEASSGLLNEMWEYDGTNWTQVPSTFNPSPRKEMSIVYDDSAEKIISFAGATGGGGLPVSSELWRYGEFEPTNPPSYGLDRNVYVIVYDPTLSNGQKLSTFLGWNDHTQLTADTINLFKSASNNRMNYTVVETTIVNDWPVKADGFQYNEASYLDVINGITSPHSPDLVDYNAIVNDAALDICGKANAGTIDEVWIYNGPHFGFWESTLVGPNAYFYNSSPVPTPFSCNRLIPIMGPSPERSAESAVHNFGHRTESTMRQLYGSWEQNSTDHSWERFALVDVLSPSYAYSGCGNTHYPPNATTDYDYDNGPPSGSITPPPHFQTNCEEFLSYPTVGTTTSYVDCTLWGCNELGYHAYWFGHLPANVGCDADGYSNDWWIYFANPALALTPTAACVPTATHISMITSSPHQQIMVMLFVAVMLSGLTSASATLRIGVKHYWDIDS